MAQRSLTVEHIGCGCRLCRQPLPDPAPVWSAEAAERQARYEASRSAHRVRHPLTDRARCQ